MKHFYLTLIAVIAAVFNMNAVDAVYFAGKDNDWAKIPFTKVDDVTWKISLSSLKQSFKLVEVDSSEIWIGGNGSDKIAFNDMYQAWGSGGSNIEVGTDISSKTNLVLTYNSYYHKMIVTDATITDPIYFYPESIYIVGNLSEGSWLENPVELKRLEDGYYEEQVDFSPTKNGEAYFSFISNKTSVWSDVGTRYCPTTNTEVSSESGSVKYFDLATYSSGDQKAYFLSYIEEESTYRIGVNLKTMKLLVGQDVKTGVADVEVSDDALVNVYNFSGVAVRQGVKASEATLGLPKGLYIVGGKKVIVK